MLNYFIFPDYFNEILLKTPIEKINEVRLRLNKKIVLIIGKKTYYLGKQGLTGVAQEALVCDKNLIMDTFKRACESSVYAYNNQIKYGYITVKGGVRIGIGGEGVYENNELKTLKNINSLAVRFPHEIQGCSNKILPYLININFLNTLIISPPGAGKTTLIRDIIQNLSKQDYCYNILICDERAEIANCFDGVPTLDIGNFSDVLSGISKNYAFECGIRSLRPDIIVCDELGGANDFKAIEFAKNCGVSVLASIHAKDLFELKNKPDFYSILKNKIFNRFVILSNRNGPGTIEAIYDENLRLLIQS